VFNNRKGRSRVAGMLWGSLPWAAVAVSSAGLWALVSPAQGQIFTTGGQLIPGTQGITPGPGVDLSAWNTSGHDLEQAELGNIDLTSATFLGSDLMQADFTSSNLTNVDFTDAELFGSTLTNAILTGATINGADLGSVTGLTSAQLYSTASYTSGNLMSVGLEGNNLAGWSFANVNLSNSNLEATTLTGADFTNADLTNVGFAGGTNLTSVNFTNANLTNANLAGATLTNANFTGAIIDDISFDNATGFAVSDLYATQSYAAGNLSEINLQGLDLSGGNFANLNLSFADFSNSNLTSANFTNANLTNVTFQNATITGADLTGATITGADFYNTKGLAASQLYSTASYAGGNLGGVSFYEDNLSGFSFADQNLTKALFFESTLDSADFTGANLANANFTLSTLTDTSFRDADLRGANGFSPTGSTITQNTILPNGAIQGLALGAGETLVVRNNPIPVMVNTSATFDPAATLQFQLAPNWSSPVGFASGVTPALNGTLDLEFAPGVDTGLLLGSTFQLFNYTAPLAAGNQFSSVTTAPQYAFKQSNLYTTGAATLIEVPAVTLGTSTTPATLQLPPGVGQVTTFALTINPGSTLDITNNAIAIDYIPGNSPAATIRQLLASGYGGDTWTGPGIDSSAAALNPGLYAVGYADGSVDQGTPAAANQVLVMYTLAGDANLDGTVNFADLLAVAQNFNHPLDTHGNPIDWADGDFNYDGIVNFADLLLIAQNFNKTLSAGQLEELPGSFGAAWNLALAEVRAGESDNVPEPATVTVLAAAAGGLLVRRRRPSRLLPR
jgi:uncharacterized protein YjbI with pentapeptide repeats